MRRSDISITIGHRRVGDGRPLFVMAEIGLNHGGSLSRALSMVDAAADAGVSAVKLQTLEADLLVSGTCPPPAHVAASSLSEFFGAFELDEAAHHAVAERARRRGLAFVSTPLSLEAVSLLDRVGVDAIKIASGDLTWDGLIQRAARTGKPLILSTGMASLDEVARAVMVARLAGASQIALLHCVSAYPVPSGSENLQVIETLRRTFSIPAGLSDHAPDTFAVPLAVAYGASIYERHLMLEDDEQAIDAPVSSTAGEFAALIHTARRARASLGDGNRQCQPCEAPNLVPSRRALHARGPLRRGTVLAATDLIALRPGAGISPNALDEVIGATLLCDLAAGEPLQEEQLQLRRERRTA